jgi:hypothetical protein
VKRLSLRPDPWNRWIYQNDHPRYNSDEAKDLRERHGRALQSAPQWMRDEALGNDYLADMQRHDIHSPVRKP